jgi:ABC-type uncharacterized transport system permease subunit
MQTSIFIIAALLYAACALVPARYAKYISVGTVVAWLLHGASLWGDVIASDSLRVGFAMMLSAALWISVLAYWLENHNFSLDSLRMLMLPWASIGVVLPLAFPGNVVPLEGKSTLFLWHIAIAILAYSTLTIAAFHAVLMALQESRLHTRSGLLDAGWFVVAIDRLPALLTMEKLLFRLIFIGFVLLTLTVLSGVVFSEQLFGKALTWDHKTIFTMLSWLLFGVLLAGRRWRGWRGKMALGLTIAGFSTLLLAYVGSRFVFEVVLHRGFV